MAAACCHGRRQPGAVGRTDVRRGRRHRPRRDRSGRRGRRRRRGRRGRSTGRSQPRGRQVGHRERRTQDYAAGNVSDGNRPPTGRAPTTRSRSGCRSTSAPSVASTGSCCKLPTPAGGRAPRRSPSRAARTGRRSPTSSASAGRSFDPAAGNTVTITSPPDHPVRADHDHRQHRLAGRPALRARGLRPGTGGDTQPPTAPGSLAYTEPATGQIRLTWTASTDNVGVTGYDVYANGTLRASVAGTALTYTDTQPATATVTYYVRAQGRRRQPSPATATRSPGPAPAARARNLARGQADHRVRRRRAHVRRGERERRRHRRRTGRARRRLPEHADRRSSAPTRPSARSWSS